MTTITRELAKLFRKITNSEIDAEGNAHVVLSPADSLLINNARIALASLEAEPVCYLTWHQGFSAPDDCEEYFVEAKLGDKSCDGSPAFPVYAAPPAPVAVPECFKRLLHHAYGMTMGHDWNKGTMAGHHRAKLCQAVEECRAAMLQGKAEPVSNRDELLTVCAEAYQVVGAMAEALGVFDSTEVQKVMDNLSQQKLVHADVLPFAVPGGNSPVIPDSLVMATIIDV